MQVAEALSSLKLKLQERIDAEFIPLTMRHKLNELENNGQIDKRNFVTQTKNVNANCLNYLNKWAGNFAEVDSLQWICLSTTFNRVHVEKTF